MDILPQLLVNSLIAGSIYALASSGLALTYGLLRILNFAHGHLMMVGAYVFYAGSVQLGLGLVSAGFFAALLMILISAFALFVFVLPFTRFSFFLPFVTTLALSTILESAVAMIFGVNVKSLTTGLDIRSFEIAGVYITPIQIIIIVSAIVLLSIAAFIIHSTSIGRTVRALSEHSSAAESLGISRIRVSYAVFILGSLLAAYSGILIGYETNMQPTMGNAYTIKAFAAMILGGLGNIWGTVAGSYMLGLVENLSIGLEVDDLIYVMLAVMWAGVLVFDGLLYSRFGRGRRLKRRLARERRGLPPLRFWEKYLHVGAITAVLGWIAYMAAGVSIPAGYKDAFAFAIILVVLLFKPKGLFNTEFRAA